MVSFLIPSPCTGFLLISALGFFHQEEAFLGPVRIVPARLVHSVLGEQLDGNEGCSQSWGKGAQIIWKRLKKAPWAGCRAGGRGRGLQKEGGLRGEREHLLEMSIPVRGQEDVRCEARPSRRAHWRVVEKQMLLRQKLRVKGREPAAKPWQSSPCWVRLCSAATVEYFQSS